jgi:RimJ/RimL family protein N-acetyltransferase
MLDAHWPLFGLRVVTPRLEIRLPRDEDLAGLLEVVAEGIHDPATMPFLNPWTDAPPAERTRSSLQWWWGARARWTPEEWNYTGAVFVDGRPVGVQDLMAQQFPKLGVVKTGSWLGRQHQGRGLGKEMRAAVLHLAFEGLGAREAESGAWADNAASIAVSRALGYRESDGGLALRRGQPDRLAGFTLVRDEWLARRRDDIVIEGLEPCLAMFGAGGEPSS